MNKLKTYREYIILIVIAALLLLYIIFRTAGNINYSLPEPPTVGPESINRISIEGPEILDFSKTDDQWYIDPELWQADNSNLSSIVKALADVKITDLISTSGNPGIYALDEEQRVLVKAWDGDKLVRELYVGKVSDTGIYTYIMLPGDDNIYSVRGNIASRVTDKKSMRDKRFLQIDRDSILKMDLITGGETLSLAADDEKLQSVISMLDPMRCKDFLYEEAEGSPEWVIDVLTSDNGLTRLEIWPETNNLYPARSSQNGYLVEITPYAVEKLLEAFGIEFAEEE